MTSSNFTLPLNYGVKCCLMLPPFLLYSGAFLCLNFGGKLTRAIVIRSNLQQRISARHAHRRERRIQRLHPRPD